MNTKELWNNCLSEIETSISKANFTTWFKNTSIAKEDGGILYIGVPNEFVKDWLYNKFHKLILKTLMKEAYFNKNLTIQFIKSYKKFKNPTFMYSEKIKMIKSSIYLS